MSGMTANEAVEYATDEAFLNLYGIVFLGVLFSAISTAGLGTGGGAGFLGMLFFVLSRLAYLVGGVAILHKLLTESV